MALSQVFNIDCLEGMKQYPDKYFDLAIVDPPYGIGEHGGKSESRCRATGVKPSKYVNKGWDNQPPQSEYFHELIRASKNQIIWGANHFGNLAPTSCWVVWDKVNGENDFADCELAWTSFDTAVRQFTYKWHGMLQQDMKNKEQRIHPTQKPVALYKWLLTNYARPGDKILDTHLGSGSSRIAAYDMGFDFTGYEIDKDYFEAQEKRFQTHIRQLDLFKEGSQQKPTFTQLTID